MTEHDKLTADEREAVERENNLTPVSPHKDEVHAIKAEFYRLNRETHASSTTILVHMVLAARFAGRRDADRRVEEARAKALQDLATWHEGQVEILEGELARSSGEVTHVYTAMAHHRMAAEEARAFAAEVPSRDGDAS